MNWGFFPALCIPTLWEYILHLIYIGQVKEREWGLGQLFASCLEKSDCLIINIHQIFTE